MRRKRNSSLQIISWRLIRRKLFRHSSGKGYGCSNDDIIVLHTNNGNLSQELSNTSSTPAQDIVGPGFVLTLLREDVAAITIQASFRRHLARRAYRALKSLVKLQALVRGVVVRRQARIALQCMQALARLQITVRARQLHLLRSNRQPDQPN